MSIREFIKTAFTQTPEEQVEQLVAGVFRNGYCVSGPTTIEFLKPGDVLIPALGNENAFARAVVVEQLSDNVEGFDPDDSYFKNPHYQYTIKSCNQTEKDNAENIVIPNALSLRTVFSKQYGLIRQAAIRQFDEIVWVNFPQHAHVLQKTPR